MLSMKRNLIFCLSLAILICAGSKKEESQKIKSKQENQKTSSKLVRHNQNGKWGYTDATGKIAIEPRFDFAYEFSGNGRALVKLDDKWGVVDATGNWVIAPQFDEARDFHESMAPVRLGDKWGYIDATGKVAITPQFDFADDFYKALARVRLRGKWVMIGKNGSSVDEPRFEYTRDFPGGYARVWLNGRWCYIDTTGNIAVAPQFYFPEQNGFSEGLAGIKFRDKWGYVDGTGNIVIIPQFDEVGNFQKGLARVKVGNKWGYINTTGVLVAKPQFDEVGDFYEGMARVRVGDKWGYVNTAGVLVAKPQFTEAEDFDFWHGWAQAKLGNIWGYINKASEWRIELPKETGDLLRADVCDEVGYNLGAWSYDIDTTGTLISFKSQFEGYFSDGLVKAKIKGKWGYVDSTGKIVIAPKYHGAGDFSEGRALVLIDPDQNTQNIFEMIRYIDKTGKIVSVWEADTAAAPSHFESEASYKTKEKLNVLSRSGLKLRETPNPNAKTLRVVPYGEQVSVLEDKAEKIKFKLDGINGYWILARYGDITGYIFDGFLSRLPAPPEDCYSIQQYVDEKLAGSDKREKIVINFDDSGSHSVLEVQKCRYGTILEMHQGWESRSETLRIPHIRLEEGFLIAQLCSHHLFEKEIFPENSSHIQKSAYEDPEHFSLSIRKNEKNQVEITLDKEL